MTDTKTEQDLNDLFEDDDDEDLPEMTDEEIEEELDDLFAEAGEDFSEIEEFVDEHAGDYCGDLLEIAFRKAVQNNLYDYVSAHIDDVDLNDEGGYSSYLYETDDKEMQTLLLESGAYENWEDYEDHRFAVETTDWTIISFKQSFQREVFERYLETYGLTCEQVIHALETGEAIEDDAFGRDLADDMACIGVSAENGEIIFEDLTGESLPETPDLLEELGYGCKFRGESWKLETIGVYSVE